MGWGFQKIVMMETEFSIQSFITKTKTNKTKTKQKKKRKIKLHST